MDFLFTPCTMQGAKDLNSGLPSLLAKRAFFQLIYLLMRCPASHLRGCITVFQKRRVTGRMKQGALQKECLNAFLELTVFTGFENGGISKSLFEAIGRMQVVRGIKKTIFLAC